MTELILANISAERIAEALPKGRRIRQDEYKACCPSHSDNNPSLSISQKADKVLVHCWSGCSQAEVIDALRSMHLWPDKKKVRSHPGFTKGEREYMAIWVATFQANTAKGHQPTPEETQKYERYCRVIGRILND